MRSFRFASRLTLAEEGLYRAEALRVGHWDYPGLDGGLSVTPELLSELYRNFKGGAKGYEVPVDGPCRGGEAHSDSDAHDCGWVKGLELSADGNVLTALIEITNEDVRQMVDEGSLRYCSSELDFAWFDPEDKREKRVFEGLALTNRPYIKRLAPLAPVNLAEFEDEVGPLTPSPSPRGGEGSGKEGFFKTGDETMPMTLEQAQAEIARLKEQVASGDSTARLTELQTKLAEAEAREKASAAQLAEMDLRTRAVQKQLRLSDATARLKALVNRGKLTRPMYERAVSLTDALLDAEGGTVVKLASKRKLEEGGEAVDTLDVVDQVLDILESLPASISDDAELAEDDDDEKKDEDEKLEAAAKAAMKEDPKLSLHDAYVLAERKVRGGAR